jgi:hypothetical protein
MTTAANSTAPAQRINDCFWIEDPKKRNAIKITAGIVAALAAIALMGTIFLVLAQQGYNLGGLNSIVQHVAAQGLYVGIAFAGAIFTASLITIAFTSKCEKISGQSVTFEEKCKKAGLDIAEINNNYIVQKMPKSSYWNIDPRGTPPVYALLIKDENSNVDLKTFTTEKARQASITKLGYCNGAEAYQNSPEYPEELMRASLPKFQEINQQAARLPKGTFNVCTERTNTNNVVYIFATNPGTPEVRYFKEIEKRNDFLQPLGLVDINDVTAKAADIERSYHLDIILSKEKDYWLETNAVNVNGKNFDIFYFREYGRINKHIFEAGTKVVTQKEDAKKVFEECPEYPRDLAPILIMEAALTEAARSGRSAGDIFVDTHLRLVDYAKGLFNNEYYFFAQLPINHAVYPQITILITKDAKNGIQYHFFKDKTKLDEFLLFNVYSDGLKRQTADEKFAILACDAYLNSLPQDRQPKLLYKIAQQREGQAHVVMYKYDDATQTRTIDGLYIPCDQLNVAKTDILNGYTEVTQEEVSKLPLSIQETEILLQHLQEIHNKQQNIIPAKHYLIALIGDLVLLYIRAEDVNNVPFFYSVRCRKDSAEYKNFTNDYDNKGYTHAILV